MSQSDTIQSFFSADGCLHGRLVQLDSSLNGILGRQGEVSGDPRVHKLLAETLVLTALLGGILKFEGTFSLQTNSDGAVGLLVGDMTTQGALRGYVRVDKDRLATLPAEADSATLLGRGHLAFSVRQGDQALPYQGVVELAGDGLLPAALTYFRQSAQLETRLLIAVSGSQVPGWRGRGLLLQRLPANSNPQAMNDNSDAASVEDNWDLADACFATLGQEELLGFAGTPEAFLRRLLPLPTLTIGGSRPLYDQCSCSRQRVAGYLAQIAAAELQELIEDNKITVTCEFCRRTYDFDEAQLADLAKLH